MTGDARARFCADCKLNVYNLSELSTDEARELIREKEGQLCVRFFTRADGTVLTRDCPVGISRRRRLIAGGSALVASAAGLAALVLGVFSQPEPTGTGCHHRRAAVAAHRRPAGLGAAAGTDQRARRLVD